MIPYSSATAGERALTEQIVWIALHDGLPPYGERVLVCYGSAGWRSVQIGNRRKTDKQGEHWRDDNEKDISPNLRIYCWAALPRGMKP